MAHSNYMAEAYAKMVAEPVTRKERYVTLYRTEPRYGGPEEGGWCSEDTVMVSTVMVTNEDEAHELKARIDEEATAMTDASRRQHNEQCLRETEWLDARGLDDDFLPEVDGHEEYFVTVEERAGSLESQGADHYE